MENNSYSAGSNDPLSRLGEMNIASLEISKRQVQALARAGIVTIADLTPLTEHDLFLIKGIAKQSVQEIRQALARALESPFDYIEDIPAGHPGELVESPPLNTWAQIIEPFLRSEKEIRIHVLLSRFGMNRRTLGELAVELGISEERVRQIEIRTARALMDHTASPPANRLLAKITQVLAEAPGDLSPAYIKATLMEMGILGSFSAPVSSGLHAVEAFETLICWLEVMSNIRFALPPRRFPVGLGDLRKRPRRSAPR